jgi:effector-binding domain-containing protein
MQSINFTYLNSLDYKTGNDNGILFFYTEIEDYKIVLVKTETEIEEKSGFFRKDIVKEASIAMRIENLKNNVGVNFYDDQYDEIRQLWNNLVAWLQSEEEKIIGLIDLE